jgi:AcrR family transcriptional regulator
LDHEAAPGETEAFRDYGSELGFCDLGILKVTPYSQLVTLGGGFLRPSADGPVRTRARTSERAMDLSRDKAIAAAVLQVLADVGYRGLTMDEVAIAAGVSKATIYRRWSSKVELLASFVEVACDETVATTDTGSLRGDLLVFMKSTACALECPTGRATRAMIGAMAEDPVVAEAYRRGPLSGWDENFEEIIDRAVSRGEVDPRVASSVTLHAGAGILLQFWFVRGKPLDDALVTEIVDEVMLPLLVLRK